MGHALHGDSAALVAAAWNDRPHRAVTHTLRRSISRLRLADDCRLSGKYAKLTARSKQTASRCATAGICCLLDHEHQQTLRRLSNMVNSYARRCSMSVSCFSWFRPSDRWYLTASMSRGPLWASKACRTCSRSSPARTASPVMPHPPTVPLHQSFAVRNAESPHRRCKAGTAAACAMPGFSVRTSRLGRCEPGDPLKGPVELQDLLSEDEHAKLCHRILLSGVSDMISGLHLTFTQ